MREDLPGFAGDALGHATEDGLTRDMLAEHYLEFLRAGFQGNATAGFFLFHAPLYHTVADRQAPYTGLTIGKIFSCPAAFGRV